MKSDKVLFIGGAVDGQRLSVPEGSDYHYVPTEGFNQQMYKAELLYYVNDHDGVQYHIKVMFFCDNPKDNLIKKLVEGYKKCS